jgi:hypothetical protein
MHGPFVTGPIGTRGLRLIERCQECAKTSEASGCTGFGPGCLALARRAQEERPEASPRSARLWTRFARLLRMHGA